VSHAPVREALRDMEMLGFVVSSPFRGAAVRSLSVEDLVQMYPIRAVLEGLAAREAASRIDAAGLVQLRKLSAAMRRAADRGDARAEVDADIAFHLAIVEASGNAFLKQIWELMQWATISFITASKSLRPVMERHLSVLEALEAQDPAAAETAMRSHIEQPAQRLRAAIERDRDLSDKLGLVRQHTPKRARVRR